ncbi:MAG: DUF3987 domain-containing protein [Verrucomicrobiae bacterium]|nr:DUF3987 domain-containing protein [Verrucomicrobiae bacterium]
MKPPDSIKAAERDLATWYVAHGVSLEGRIPSSFFHDPVALALLRAIELLEESGSVVSRSTVQIQLGKEERLLPCGLGEIVSLLLDPEITEQPGEVAAILEREVMGAGQRRAAAHQLRCALSRLGQGEDPDRVLAEIQSHHTPGFGSLGSFDPEPIRATPFPTGALPPVCAEVVREISRVAMVPESLAAACVIGVVSAAIGAGLRIRNYRGTTGANLFLMPIAASGTGKDSALNLAAKPLFDLESERLDRWEREVRPNLVAHLRRVKAKLAAAEKRKTTDLESEVNLREEICLLEREKTELERQIEARPDLIVGDCTKEALGVAMASKPNEAIAGISAEARGILGTVQGRYSKGSDEDFFAGGFSGTPLKVTRIGRPTVRLTQPCLALLWMIQPDAFRKLAANSDMVDSGFVPRFLVFDTLAEPGEVPADCPAFDPSIEAKWRNLIRGLVETFHDASEASIVEATLEASEALRDFDNHFRMERRSGGSFADIAPFVARWPEIAWRLSLCLHTAFYEKRAAEIPLASTHARNILRLMNWFVPESLNLLGGLREEQRRTRKERLRELLAGAVHGHMTLRDLRKSHGFDPGEIEAVARSESWLRIDVVQNERGGPRSKVAVYVRERP